jgi:hypothetical protein
MKLVALVISTIILISSCDTTRQINSPINQHGLNRDTFISHSLFADRLSTITEEGIQQILDGTYKLPQQLRVAIVRIDNNQQGLFFYWNDEEYLKTQQSYLDLFGDKFKQSSRVIRVSTIPDLLISKTPSFTNIREAAVRLQADIVVVYSITSDIYSKYKLFTRPDIKAFATTQLIILDVRTGLIPFSTIITKDILSQRKKEELDNAEARNRIQNEAVLLTINEITQKISDFLSVK